MDELGDGRLVQLLVTNWPKIELNHTVVAYAYRVDGHGVEFGVWDPNEPDAPGVITFDRGRAALLGHPRVRHRARRPSGPSGCTTRGTCDRSGGHGGSGAPAA